MSHLKSFRNPLIILLQLLIADLMYPLVILSLKLLEYPRIYADHRNILATLEKPHIRKALEGV